MTEFTIKLADDRGRVQEQTHSAATAEELRARFTQAGYLVYSVKARSALNSGSKKKVKLDIFLVFNQQFLTLIRAGLPILSSLDLLAKRQKEESFQAQLEDVTSRIKTGESISSAFEAQGSFPLVYTTTLLAGERSGNLEEVLQRFLDFQRVSLTFRKKLKASLIYPAFLIVMVIGLFIFLITFVVPRFAQLYDQLGTKLPALTLFMLALGQDVQHYGLYILPVLILIGYLLVRWSKTDSGATTIDKIRVASPIFGKVWLKYQVGLFSRTLATLLTGGLPLVPSLETAARSIDSRQIAKAVYSSVETVREGKGLASSLDKTGVFPELAIEMIEVGESTGALPQMLNSVAEFFEEDVQTSLAAIMSMIEPVILIVMGVVVVVIMIALYEPIFSLNGTG
ncbi:type II secretion system F family protein [Granulicella mallensis]|jgi:type IV pilus assembly protein PilC|uniref:Type II secretion system F domain protein n=1 Tax=Granulicella mallensis (strain ATCC BAA-1857 / DSM 23137 / MP5ACTX8) TaxID=682795 RepID=G8NR27_GRAMM|nr:type II secretion system F family protein [Granulicella mallensis]AEU35012.1 Type II secretion system F domain protein [Granulicella mallensis MP5ACTX8]